MRVLKESAKPGAGEDSLKVDIASSELSTDNTRIFSMISSGNLLLAFELMSICAFT